MKNRIFLFLSLALFTLTLNSCIVSSIFKANDSNRDEKISKKEYTSTASPENKKGLEQEFDKFDTNQDGFLTKEEFKASVFDKGSEK